MPLTGAGELAITPTGEVHYSVEVRYRKTLDALKGESHGVTISNEYLDEAGNPKTSFKVGDVVRVRLVSELPGDADHLMLSDALPAGFEAINARFQTSGTASVTQTTEWGTYREMHDDRVNFASQYTSHGRRVHEFQIRAIAAGKFARPPTMAELMYLPEIDAQTALDIIEIKPK